MSAPKQRTRRGRPPKLKTLLRRHAASELALTVLAAAARGALPGASPHDRVLASRELLDREHGRPTAPIAVRADVQTTQTHGVLVVEAPITSADWSPAAVEHHARLSAEQATTEEEQ